MLFDSSLFSSLDFLDIFANVIVGTCSTHLKAVMSEKSLCFGAI